MALDLVPASTQYLSAASSVVNLNVGTFAGWFNTDLASTNVANFYFFDTDGARHAFYRVGSNVIQMYNDGRATDFAVAFSAGALLHLAFVYNKTGNIQQAYMNGLPLSVGGAGVSGTWGTTALGTNFHCGARFNGTEMFDGDVSEVATWGVELTAAEIKILAAGYSPSFVRPASLRAYWKLIRNGAPSHGSVTATLNGSPAVTTQNRMLYPAGLQMPIPKNVAAAAGGDSRIILQRMRMGMGL